MGDFINNRSRRLSFDSLFIFGRMAKNGKKKEKSEKKEVTEKKVMKEKERPMEEVIEDTQRTPKEECTEKSCSCCKPCCCMSCPLCPLKCYPLRLFLFTLLFAVGFIFYLIIRDVSFFLAIES